MDKWWVVDVCVGTRLSVAGATTTDEDRAIRERSATETGQRARQVSHLGIRVVVRAVDKGVGYGQDRWAKTTTTNEDGDVRERSATVIDTTIRHVSH